MDYREQSQAIWQSMSAGWERERRWMWDASRQVSEWLVDRLDPRPGETILELAAGTGETGFAIAPRLGDEGRLISTDFAPGMVEAARRGSAELGLGNVEHRVMDAERIDLPDGSVDGVVCRWAYMLMADPAAALEETRHVLRDGGRVAASTWANPQKNPWATISRAALVERGHMQPPEPDAPGIFGISTEPRMRDLMTGAGFSDVAVEEVDLEFRFEGVDDYWRYLHEIAGAVAMVLRELGDEELAEVRAAVERGAEPYRANGAYVMPGTVLNAIAR